MKESGKRTKYVRNRQSAPQSVPNEGKAQSAPASEQKPERIAKRIARAGLCSRRQAESWIEEGRVSLNGKILDSPAITVTLTDKIEVDGNLLPGRERTRLWLYHKPSGCLTTNKDPEGRPTLFERLPKDLPRLLSVGRLDMNTEGLLLMTNDGGLARVLELPATGWLRRYRVRAHGRVDVEKLEGLKEGIAVDGVLYGSIEASVEREQGHNTWLNVAIREGKNREIKNVMGAIGLSVNRLIRISYGPFQLSDLPVGELREIRGRTLRDQLGERLVRDSGADFDAPLINLPKPAPDKNNSQNDKPAKKYKDKQAPGTMGAAMMERLSTKKRPADNRANRSANHPANSSRKRRG